MLQAIAWVTFLEGIRNKAVYGITLLAGLMMAFTVALSGMIMRDVGKVATDFALSTATFAALLVVLFVGITILARDMERKTVYLALSRAVPRSRYLLGRFSGLALLQSTIMVLLLAASLATLLMIKQIYPTFFGSVSLWLVCLAHLFILLQMLLLTALSMLFSLVASSSFVTFLLTTLTWLIGSSTQEVKQMIEAAGPDKVSPAVKLLVQLAYYLFPNFALFDLKATAAHGLAINTASLGFSLVYGLGYSIAVLSVAVVLFKRKELT
ncbi:MAG: ABC transporter permease subunit [Trichlorobacter sp.]|jgi:ABC-type transport system involved in multi-copper enzyme maturation permease subunit